MTFLTRSSVECSEGSEILREYIIFCDLVNGDIRATSIAKWSEETDERVWAALGNLIFSLICNPLFARWPISLFDLMIRRIGILLYGASFFVYVLDRPASKSIKIEVQKGENAGYSSQKFVSFIIINL